MIRLAVRVAAEQAELVLAELLELAPSGVEEAAPAPGIVEYAVYGAPGELPELPDLRAAAGGALVEIRTTEVEDDWADRWREFHRPVRIGDRLTVRPPWEPPADTELQLIIDPARAFGTGAHATTRLCLELLLALAPGGPLLDLGCGSGVLAIAAAKLGWSPVLAVDFDPLSVEATVANAGVNGVQLAAEHFDLRAGDPPPSAPTVTANLLRPLLLMLAGTLGAAGPSALPERLIASGLLAGETDEVAAAFAAIGMHEARRLADGDWAALLLEQRTGA